MSHRKLRLHEHKQKESLTVRTEEEFVIIYERCDGIHDSKILAELNSGLLKACANPHSHESKSEIFLNPACCAGGRQFLL